MSILQRGHPTNIWQINEIVLREIIPETRGVKTFQFDFSEPRNQDQFPGTPGQFNMLYVPGYGEAAISLSEISNEPGRIVHTVRKIGDVTNAIFRLAPGESIGCRGPFGTGWPVQEARGRHLIVAAGGIGLGPVRPVILQQLQQSETFSRLTVLIGSRSSEYLLYRSQYESWKQQGIEVHATVDRTSSDWSGNVGFVTTLLDRVGIPDPQNTSVFVCGPEVMMRQTAISALEREVPEQQIWLSMERHMNCAVGHCGRCQFGGHFVCNDGPVFRYPNVRQLLAIPEL